MSPDEGCNRWTLASSRLIGIYVAHLERRSSPLLDAFSHAWWAAVWPTSLRTQLISMPSTWRLATVGRTAFPPSDRSICGPRGDLASRRCRAGHARGFRGLLRPASLTVRVKREPYRKDPGAPGRVPSAPARTVEQAAGQLSFQFDSHSFLLGTRWEPSTSSLLGLGRNVAKKSSLSFRRIITGLSQVDDLPNTTACRASMLGKKVA